MSLAGSAQPDRQIRFLNINIVPTQVWLVIYCHSSWWYIVFVRICLSCKKYKNPVDIVGQLIVQHKGYLVFQLRHNYFFFVSVGTKRGGSGFYAIDMYNRMGNMFLFVFIVPIFWSFLFECDKMNPTSISTPPPPFLTISSDCCQQGGNLKNN